MWKRLYQDCEKSNRIWSAWFHPEKTVRANIETQHSKVRVKQHAEMTHSETASYETMFVINWVRSILGQCAHCTLKNRVTVGYLQQTKSATTAIWIRKREATKSPPLNLCHVNVLTINVSNVTAWSMKNVSQCEYDVV